MKKLSALLMISNLLWAHGMDVPGPHGGFIQMPGAFHTEVIMVEGESSIRVYLLDMENQNPTLKDSEVTAWVLKKKKRTDLKCAEVLGQNFFSCPVDIKKIKPDQLVVKAKREGLQGNEAVYKLPLSRK